MILRRLNDHVKSQNWFAVALDLIVVVVGIFIGFQVNLWNEARKDRVLERQYLDRLHDEIALAVQSLERDVAYEEVRATAVERVWTFLNQESLEPEDPTRIRDGIALFHRNVGSRVAIGVFRELESSGRMALLRDSTLRASLIELAAQLEYIDQQLALVRDLTVDLKVRFPHLIRVLERNTRDPVDVSKVTYSMEFDLAGMRSDNLFRNTVTSSFGRIQFLRDLKQEALDIAKRTLSRLESSAGPPQAPAPS